MPSKNRIDSVLDSMDLHARILAAMICVILMLTAACAEDKQPQPVQQAAEEPFEGTIVAMGNSLTEGYGLDPEMAFPARLESLLHAKGYRYQVFNAGISGETSSGALSRIDWVHRLEPDIIIIETGAHDAFRGVETELIEDNLARIIQNFQTRGVIVVLAGMKMVTNLGPRYTSEFENLYQNLARRFELIFMPFFLEGVAGEPGLNQPDGIHPTTRGYGIIVDNIYPYVVMAIEQHRRKAGPPAG